MFVYDVNGDGLADILSARPHDRGRWWIEKLLDVGYVQHEMDPEPLGASFSETHAARVLARCATAAPIALSSPRPWRSRT